MYCHKRVRPAFLQQSLCQQNSLFGQLVFHISCHNPFPYFMCRKAHLVRKMRFYSVKFCASRKVKLRRGHSEVLYFVQREVKCAFNVRRHFTAKQLHDAKHHFTSRKAHLVRKKRFCPRTKALFSWQRMRDSNPRKRSQSPVCYRYTNPLCGRFACRVTGNMGIIAPK